MSKLITRYPGAGSRPKRIFFIACALLLPLAAWALYRADPRERAFIPCLLHSLTGLYCPGCGTTRAVYLLLHGDFLGALRMNPILPVSLPLIAYGLADFVLFEGWGIKLPPKNIPLKAVLIVLAVLLAYGVLRNLPFPAFEALRPPA
ncbi:MAG: DUF2752 domain-containing protein [Christensenellales bacterium]